MEDRIKTIIRDWLNKTFGNPDALPTPVLNGLAEEIDKHRWEIYRYQKDEYDMDDIDAVALDYGIKLTDEEREMILHKYQDCEYQDMDAIKDLLGIYIKREGESE